MANLLSKIKIGTVVYDLKDAQARQDIATLLGGKAAAALGTAAFLNSVTTISEGGTNLPTEAAVHAAIQTAVAGLSGAMHFRGVFETLPGTEGYASGDVIIVGNKEYVFDGTGWKELGDESIYLTTAAAIATYVPKVRTICGLDLQDDVTAEEMKTALGLGKLAFVDEASGTIDNFVTGLTGATYTPAGSVHVEFTNTDTNIDSTGKFTPKGTISKPTITITPVTTKIKKVTDGGTLPTLGTTKGQFATSGFSATLDSADPEMLVLSEAGKADAITSTTFTQGAMPTFEETGTDVMTGFNAPVISDQTFTGTEENVTVTGKYKLASVDDTKNTFTGTETIITPTLTKVAKSVTVGVSTSTPTE